MEEEIVALCEVLDQPGMPGVSGKLTDSEGFPRADIDIPQTIAMRGRVACLNTDLSAKMKQIEALLTELHSLNRVEADDER